MVVDGALVAAAVTCLIQLRTTIEERWRLWQTLQAWEAAGSFNALRRRLLACRIPTSGGWWGILSALQPLVNSEREQDCIVKHVLNAREENEAFPKRFLTIVLCTICCIQAGSVLLLWRGRTLDQSGLMLQDTDGTVEECDRKPLFKRLRSKWRKYSLRGKLKSLKIHSYKKKFKNLKNFSLKKKLKNMKNRLAKRRLKNTNNTSEDQLMKDLENYMMTTRRKEYIKFLKVVTQEVMRVLWSLTIKSLRRKLGLDWKTRYGGRGGSQRKWFNEE